MTELLNEAVRARRAPGIGFADGPAGRRAIVAGTGLDVWEVIAVWRDCGQDYAELQQNFDWLAEAQLRAALSYYSLYPEEIDKRIERERQWTKERVAKALPFSAPGKPGR